MSSKQLTGPLRLCTTQPCAMVASTAWNSVASFSEYLGGEGNTSLEHGGGWAPYGAGDIEGAVLR